MIIFIPVKDKWIVHNSITKQFYPQSRKPTSFSKCWHSAKVREWLPKNKFKIEEL